MSDIFPVYLAFPLLAAMIYAVGSLGVRAAAEQGVSPWKATCLANMLAGLMFLIYLRGFPYPDLPRDPWGVIGLGLLFFIGNILTVLSLTYGDVSIATPVLASKVVMVVGLVVVLGKTEPTVSLWVAGCLILIGILFLQRSAPPSATPRKALVTVMLSLAAAACFAVCDVGFQMLSERDGFHRVGPYAVGFAGCLSALLYPFVRGSRNTTSQPANRFLWLGVGLLSFQSMILIYSLGTFEDAAGINIVYGSRGLWGLVAVSLVGHYFQNRERQDAGRFFRYRLAGAVCIAGAIVTSLQ